MKKFALSIIALFIAFAAFSQGESPVKWDFTAVKKGDKLYSVVITATFNKPWHIYSQTTPDGGPLATKISFKPNPIITLDGKPKEDGSLQTIHDENFNVDVKYFSDKVVFTQVLKLKAAVKTHAVGEVAFMACNDNKCLPPKKVPFDITLQ